MALHKVKRYRPLWRVLNATAALALCMGAAQAQETFSAGEAFATRFSGSVAFTLDDGTRAVVLDQEGVVGSAIDIRNPGFVANGQHWLDEPQHLEVTAGEVGQVFGIAIDDGEPANIYLTATSAFGLHRFDDNSDWLPGQWGEGGPSAIYRLNGANGYAPELLATVGLNGRENTGAGLGNIAFDPINGQLFVSDLESGMIHRLSTEGEQLNHFDHGASGRAGYRDATDNAVKSLPAIEFDPTSSAAMTDCTDATGAAAAFSSTPSCWNFADFRRRVWGLSVLADPADGSVRLYYGVWGSETFGSEEAPEEARNSIWSVAINADGSFNPADVRLEIVVPAFGADEQTARAVSDIAISQDGVMLVAERGGIRNLGLETEAPFANPQASRVLRYVQSESGQWVPDGRHDVGFNDRELIGPPFIRAGSAGGVDFGYGYNAAGRIDTTLPDGTAWMSGDALCSPEGPCVDPADDSRTDTSQVHGLQGTPATAVDAVEPAGVLGPYPASGEPYPADALRLSYLIDLDRNVDGAGTPIDEELARNDATLVGDVEIYTTGTPGEALPPPEQQGFDLDIEKTGEAICRVSTNCSFTITVTNRGPGLYTGPIYLWDVVQPVSVPFASSSGQGWQCFEVGNALHCRHEGVELAPGASTTLTVALAIPAGYRPDFIENCVSISWLYLQDGTYDIWKFQIMLALLGYEPGPFDGRIGPRTREALRAFQRDNGLAVTGDVDDATALALYPDLVGIYGDLNPGNDRSCHEVGIGKPRPPHNKVASHLKIGSPHNKAASHLKIGSPHNKAASHLKVGSPHNKAASHRKDGSPHEKAASHRKDGSAPHQKVASHLKQGSPHNKVASHRKDGSAPHNKVESHRKEGSAPPHHKVESHRKEGSAPPHSKAASHRKDGSAPPHSKAASHQKQGSQPPPHNKAASHRKEGSAPPPHSKAASHMKDGSRQPPHSKALSHRKDGSGPPPHSKAASHRKEGSQQPPVHNRAASHRKEGSGQPPHSKAASHQKSGSRQPPVIRRLDQ